MYAPSKLQSRARVECSVTIALILTCLPSLKRFSEHRINQRLLASPRYCQSLAKIHGERPARALCQQMRPRQPSGVSTRMSERHEMAHFGFGRPRWEIAPIITRPAFEKLKRFWRFTARVPIGLRHVSSPTLMHIPSLASNSSRGACQQAKCVHILLCVVPSARRMIISASCRSYTGSKRYSACIYVNHIQQSYSTDRQSSHKFSGFTKAHKVNSRVRTPFQVLIKRA